MKLEVVATPPVGRHRRLANGSSSAGIAPVALTQPTPNSEEPFMSGMAGNISAFATVWTYDIYRPIINRVADDGKCLSIGQWCTVIGLAASIGAAYLVMQFASIMDYVQALFGFFIIPLFGTVIIAMLWRRATPAGGFWGLVSGTASSVLLWLLVKVHPQALAILAFSADAKAMAENLYRFIWSWLVCVLVTIVVS